ncbi:MAG TPA: hypothetical protein VGI63_02805 [Verrucomicrobiae bacterium]
MAKCLTARRAEVKSKASGQTENEWLASNLMKTSTKAFAVIALLLFVMAGLLYHRALRDERRAKPALEQAISFEEGFSFTNTFTVPETSDCFVELVFPRDHSSTSREYDVKYRNAIGAAMEKLANIKFIITCDGAVVAKGGGDTPPICGGGSYAEQTADMARFTAEPGKNYEISFRTISSLPILDTTKPFLRISVPFWAADPFDFRYWLIPISWARDVAILGLIFAISPCSFLVQKIIQKKSRASKL